MKSLPLMHQVTVGRMRMSLLGRPDDKARTMIMIQRTHGDAESGWYPAASFRVSELPALSQAACELQVFLETGSACPPRDAAAAQAPAASSSPSSSPSPSRSSTSPSTSPSTSSPPREPSPHAATAAVPAKHLNGTLPKPPTKPVPVTPSPHTPRPASPAVPARGGVPDFPGPEPRSPRPTTKPSPVRNSSPPGKSRRAPVPAAAARAGLKRARSSR